jgi:saccharopine dehydrogenase-like NADP-dependent oxidoreductase
MHSEELHNLLSSRNVIKIITSMTIRYVRHVAHMGQMRNEYKITVGKPEGKRQLGRTTM